MKLQSIVNNKGANFGQGEVFHFKTIDMGLFASASIKSGFRRNFFPIWFISTLTKFQKHKQIDPKNHGSKNHKMEFVQQVLILKDTSNMLEYRKDFPMWKNV